MISCGEGFWMEIELVNRVRVWARSLVNLLRFGCGFHTS